MTPRGDIPLVTELVVTIARRLDDTLARSSTHDGVPDGYLHHSFTTDFEKGCDLLWQMDLALGLEGGTPVTRAQATTYPSAFKPASEAQIRDALSKGLPENTPPLLSLLQTFLSLTCDYGTDATRRLPHSRAPFRPAPIHGRVVKALANDGYLTQSDSTYAWSDNIAPAMVAAHYWDEGGQDLSELSEAEIALEARRALDTLPDDIILTNALALTDHLRHRWTGSSWKDNDTTRHDLAHLIPLARRMMAEAETKSPRLS